MDTLVGYQRGFTLIELLVVIAIIGALSSVMLASVTVTRSKSNDSYRIQTLIQLRIALELYYGSNNSYPVGCWNYLAKDGPNYIPALAPSYIAELPRDRQEGATCPGGIGDGSNLRTFYYCSNGTDYKVNVCSENPVPATSVWWDLFRPGYAFKICSSTFSCQNF